VSDDPKQKLFAYISLLEKTNEQLLDTLKHCVKLLVEFTPSAPDPHGWQEMLDTFRKTIKVGEKIVGEKPTLH